MIQVLGTYFTNSQNGLDVFPEIVRPVVGELNRAFNG